MTDAANYVLGLEGYEDTYDLRLGHQYNALVVCITGYEQDYLTGTWHTYTETITYAQVFSDMNSNDYRWVCVCVEYAP